MNCCTFLGFLTSEPRQVTQTDGKTCIKFQLAVRRPFSYKNAVDFVDFIAYSYNAKFISKYFHKGDKMAVRTYLQNNCYKGKDGTQRKEAVFNVQEVDFAVANGKSPDADLYMDSIRAEETTPKTKEYKKPKHNIDIAYEDFEEIGVDE